MYILAYTWINTTYGGHENGHHWVAPHPGRVSGQCVVRIPNTKIMACCHSCPCRCNLQAETEYRIKSFGIY